jgi:isoleucyl-tRNA synthetase
LWVASVEVNHDVPISQNILKQVSEQYRKIRNTLRFILGNVSDLTSDALVDEAAMDEIDRYTLAQLHQLNQDVLEAYDQFKFDDVFRLINQFVIELSGFYLDFTKDILYIEQANSLRRRSVQTVYYRILDSLVRLLTPILPHTMEEVYEYSPIKEAEFAQLLDMPQRVSVDDTILAKYEPLMQLRDGVLKALEEARNEKVIGKSFEAHVTLYLNDTWHVIVQSFSTNLRQALIVSKLTISQGSGTYAFDGFSVDVALAEGHTCERCWQVVDEVNSVGLCKRCETVIDAK